MPKPAFGIDDARTSVGGRRSALAPAETREISARNSAVAARVTLAFASLGESFKSAPAISLHVGVIPSADRAALFSHARMSVRPSIGSVLARVRRSRVSYPPLRVVVSREVRVWSLVSVRADASMVAARRLRGSCAPPVKGGEE
jgi:hypothetical protein